MLAKRSQIFPLLALALVFPAAALAASGTGGGDGRVAVDAAEPVALAPLQRPASRLQETIDTVMAQVRAERRAALRKRRREERELFEDLPGGVSIATLAAIAECESGGDPTVVSADGSYRGKYQFSFSTWESVGGEGDPAAAPEVEQDYRAALLYSRAGSSPWPVCG